MAVAIADDLHLRYTPRATMWCFRGVQQAIREQATVRLRGALSFQIG